MPAESAAASCGSVSERGRSYSVMITRVALPFGRGSVFNGYCQREDELRLTVLMNSADLTDCDCRVGLSPSRPAMPSPVTPRPWVLGRSCGLNRVLPCA